MVAAVATPIALRIAGSAAAAVAGQIVRVRARELEGGREGGRERGQSVSQNFCYRRLFSPALQIRLLLLSSVLPSLPSFPSRVGVASIRLAFPVAAAAAAAIPFHFIPMCRGRKGEVEEGGKEGRKEGV